MDTGSGVDICSMEDVVNLAGLVNSNADVVFHTANGPIDAGPLYPGLLKAFKECIAPYVLPSSPALLSVGKRCMERDMGSCGFRGEHLSW